MTSFASDGTWTEQNQKIHQGLTSRDGQRRRVDLGACHYPGAYSNFVAGPTSEVYKRCGSCRYSVLTLSRWTSKLFNSLWYGDGSPSLNHLSSHFTRLQNFSVTKFIRSLRSALSSCCRSCINSNQQIFLNHNTITRTSQVKQFLFHGIAFKTRGGSTKSQPAIFSV